MWTRNALAAVFGGLPLTSYSQNIGAITLTGVGSRRDITDFATRRMRQLDRESSERPWLQTVIGAMASDLPE